MTEKVLEFPNKTFEVFPTSREDAQTQLEIVRTDYCDQVSEDIMEAIYAVLHSYGFSIKSQELHIKDVVFLEEAVKAVLYRYKKIPHSLHDIIDTTVTITPEAAEALEKAVD